MPNYRYTGKQRGQSVQGVLSASAVANAAEQLLGRGITPIKIEEVKEGGGAGGIPLFGGWPTVDELILMTRQMYTLVRSGVPLVRSLQGLAETSRNPRLVAALRKLIEALQAGRGLSVAMAEHPKIFSNLYVRIVHIGEETGRLEESFKQLHHYLEVDKDTRRQVKGALRYPMFVVGAMMIALLVLNYKVIPAFEPVFKQYKTDLPVITKALFATSQFTVDYLVYIVGGLVGAVVGFTSYVNTAKGRLWWDEFKFKLPIAGSIIKRATLARFARSFAMGSRSGLPTMQVLIAVSEAVDNTYVAGKVGEMRMGVERGESLVQTSNATQMFTPLVLQMMAVGEETGNLDEMMQEVAEFYEREVEYEVKALSATIEPLLVGGIALMVLVLALGIFLPMWDLGKAALRGGK